MYCKRLTGKESDRPKQKNLLKIISGSKQYHIDRNKLWISNLGLSNEKALLVLHAVVSGFITLFTTHLLTSNHFGQLDLREGLVVASTYFIAALPFSISLYRVIRHRVSIKEIPSLQKQMLEAALGDQYIKLSLELIENLERAGIEYYDALRKACENEDEFISRKEFIESRSIQPLIDNYY